MCGVWGNSNAYVFSIFRHTLVRERSRLLERREQPFWNGVSNSTGYLKLLRTK